MVCICNLRSDVYKVYNAIELLKFVQYIIRINAGLFVCLEECLYIYIYILFVIQSPNASEGEGSLKLSPLRSLRDSSVGCTPSE